MWTLCSERLPEDGQNVLIQYADSEDKNDIVMAVGWMEGHLVYRDKRHFVCWDDRVDIFHDAVAWMPLPEPYKGE